jgi:hypothetical protein
MKKILLIIIFVFMAAPVYAFTSAIQGVVTGGVASTALSCTTSDDTAILDKIAAGETDSSEYACMKFTLATQFRVTEYVVAGDTSSGTSGGIEISIYDHNSGTDLPSTQVSGTAITLPYNETENTPFTVTLASPKDMSAGTYWVCSIATGDTGRVYDYYTSAGDRACYGSESCSTGSADTAISVRIMGCTP